MVSRSTPSSAMIGSIALILVQSPSHIKVRPNRVGRWQRAGDIINDEWNDRFVERSVRPKCRRQMLNLERGVGFSKDRFTVAQNDQFADSLGPQMKAIRSLGSGKDGLDSFEPSKNSRRGLGVSGRAKPYVTRAAESAVVLDIFVALGGEGKPEFEAAILASLGEIPTTRLRVHAVVGRDQERRIRRCSDRTAKQDVKPSEMIL